MLQSWLSISKLISQQVNKPKKIYFYKANIKYKSKKYEKKLTILQFYLLIIHQFFLVSNVLYCNIFLIFQFRQNINKMKIVSFIFIFYAFLLTSIRAVDTYLNFTTGITLKAGIKFIKTKVISSVQYLFIAYDDNTLGMYTNQLALYNNRLFSLGNKSYIQFSVYGSSYYYGITQNRNEILIISITNTSKQYCYTNHINVNNIFLLYFNPASGGIKDILVFKDDIFCRHFQSNSILSIYNRTNFTGNLTSRNYVQKVFYLSNTSHFTAIVFTSLKKVYCINIYLLSTIYTVQSIILIKDFSNISNLSVISYVMDQNQILFVQFSNFQLFAFHYLSPSINIRLPTVQANAGNSTLKSTYPFLLTDGERVFVFNDKSFRVNLSSNTYTYINTPHSNFPVTNWTELVQLSSSYSFTYTKNTASIFSYCFTSTLLTILTGCNNNVTCPISNCYLCNQAKNKCLNCGIGYRIYNYSCYPNISCGVSNCDICTNNTYCVLCFVNYTLSALRDSCTYDIILPNNTVVNITPPIDTNVTNNITIINDSVLSNNTTLTDNFTVDTNFGDLSNQTMIPPLINDNMTLPNFTEPPLNPPPSPPPLPLPFFEPTYRNQTGNRTNPPPIIAKNNTNQQSISSKRINETLQGFDPNVKQLSNLSAKINSIPAARTFLTFLSPLFGFFDDYWYYIYHLDTYHQLQYMPSFLVFMYSINNDRLVPDFLNFQPFKVDSVIKSNFTLFTNRQILQIDNQQTYFLSNIKQMLFDQYLLVILGFIFIKLIAVILKLCFKNKQIKLNSSEVNFANQASITNIQNLHDEKQSTIKQKTQNKSSQKEKLKYRIINTIQNYLDNLIGLKNMLLILFGSNFIFISFTFSSQIRQINSFNAIDLSNIILTISFGFIILAFTAFIFIFQDYYAVNQNLIKKSTRIWDYQHHKQKNYILTEQKRYCLNLTFFCHIKNLLYGFVHGFFINFPNIQYISLILIKTYLIFIVFDKNKIIKGKAVGCSLVVIYYSAGIIMDILCMLSKNLIIPDFFMQNVFSDVSATNILEIACLLTMSFSLVFQIILELFLDIKQACFSKNQIHNRIQANQNGIQNPKNIFNLLRRILPQNRQKSTKRIITVQGKIQIFNTNSSPQQTKNVLSTNNQDDEKNSYLSELKQISNYDPQSQEIKDKVINLNKTRQAYKSKVRVKVLNRTISQPNDDKVLKVMFKRKYLGQNTEKLSSQYDRSIKRIQPSLQKIQRCQDSLKQMNFDVIKSLKRVNFYQNSKTTMQNKFTDKIKQKIQNQQKDNICSLTMTQKNGFSERYKCSHKNLKLRNDIKPLIRIRQSMDVE